jgi:hypothetical protein
MGGREGKECVQRCVSGSTMADGWRVRRGLDGEWGDCVEVRAIGEEAPKTGTVAFR